MRRIIPITLGVLFLVMFAGTLLFLYRKSQAEPVVYEYIADLVHATRNPRYVLLGASPRAAVALLRAARAHAACAGSAAVTIDDVKAVARHVLAHRIVLQEPPVTTVMRAQLEYIDEVVRAVPTGKHPVP